MWMRFLQENFLISKGRAAAAAYIKVRNAVVRHQGCLGKVFDVVKCGCGRMGGAVVSAQNVVADRACAAV